MDDDVQVPEITKIHQRFRVGNEELSRWGQRVEAAARGVRDAVKVAKRTKKKKLEGQALASLAQVQQAREEHVEALSASKEAIVIFRELGDQVAEAGARHAAVSAYMGRKKLGEALDEAKKARAIFRKHGLRHDEGRALLVKSCAHKMAQEPLGWPVG
ncbi:unnamed protein product [Cladocopium goreaui]|uniref:MalT-like TPR region domain-containing protein n=1 Tax=Cladocopium goreaui TaxID=2562237 RepID=A0A9P1M544_9DINO|nr:unnamed protein product [Cladocopium goreaui]